MDKHTSKSPRKDKHRKTSSQKKRKKHHQHSGGGHRSKRPDKPEPGGKFSTSPELLSDHPGFESDGPASVSNILLQTTTNSNQPKPARLSVSGHNTGVYSATINYDPRANAHNKSHAAGQGGEPCPSPRARAVPTSTKLSSSNRKKAAGPHRNGGIMQPAGSLHKNPAPVGTRVQTASSSTSESLRWELAESDDDAEQERIRVYKLNRRKRYLAAANKNYTEWALSLTHHGQYAPSNNQVNGGFGNSNNHSNGNEDSGAHGNASQGSDHDRVGEELGGGNLEQSGNHESSKLSRSNNCSPHHSHSNSNNHSNVIERHEDNTRQCQVNKNEETDGQQVRFSQKDSNRVQSSDKCMPHKKDIGEKLNAETQIDNHASGLDKYNRQINNTAQNSKCSIKNSKGAKGSVLSKSASKDVLTSVKESLIHDVLPALNPGIYNSSSQMMVNA